MEDSEVNGAVDDDVDNAYSSHNYFQPDQTMDDVGGEPSQSIGQRSKCTHQSQKFIVGDNSFDIGFVVAVDKQIPNHDGEEGEAEEIGGFVSESSV